MTSRARILLVEDNIINQKVALQQLQKLGYATDAANNGIEALDALAKTPYDAIFMDCQMPEMDGYEATLEIRRREGNSRHTPIIALTAHALKGDREKCLAAGMDDYISKPARPEELEKAISRWISPETPAAAAAPDPEPAPHGEAPLVDLQRLQEIADGDNAVIQELVTLYIQQTSDLMEKLNQGIKNGSAPEVRQAAHKCLGGSATCGVACLLPILRELERMGFEEKLEGAQRLAEEAGIQFQKVKAFFQEKFLSPSPS